MARLIINPTAANRRELSLARDEILTIGRDPSNDLVLPDAMVSRRHAVIERRGSQFFLRDCNSANGSVVNGDRVSERGLRDGDLVAIGSMRLLFREDPPAPGAKVVPHPSSAPFHCPGCGADYLRGDLFCRDCGAQVAQPAGPARTVCPSCGSAVPLPARFCNACGAGLPEPREEAPRPGVTSPGIDEDEPQRGDERPELPAAASSPRPAGASPAGARTGQSAARAPMMSPETPARLPVTREAAPVASARRRSVPPPPRSRRSVPPRLPARPPAAGLAPRLVAGLADAVFVLSGQAVLIVPVAYYWWSRDVPRTPGDVPFLPIVATVGLSTLALLFGALYHIYFCGVRGSTPGKELLELQVEAEDGRCPIGVGRATLRVLGYLLSVASLGIGFLMIAVGGDGLHDRIAGTRVTRRGRR